MRVPAGSIYALLGPNGAGKTTTLKTLMNLRAPSQRRRPGARRRLAALGPADLAQIGYVSENQRIPSNLTIGEIEAFCRPWYPTWDAALATELRDRFGLDPQGAHPDAVARHAHQGAVPAGTGAAAAPADPRRAVQRPRSGRPRRPHHRRPQPRRSRRLERAADVARDGRRRAARRSRRLPRPTGACSSKSRWPPLLARFRRVDVALPDGAAAPAAATGLVARVHGRRPRRTIRRFAASPAAEAAWRQAFPDATIETSPMSLREVFVALTRSTDVAATAGVRR